jgi:S-phase kinase-associated protein 1
MTSILLVKTSDSSQPFSVEESLLKGSSKTVADLIATLEQTKSNNDNGGSLTIELPQISGKTFEQVVYYLNHRKDDPPAVVAAVDATAAAVITEEKKIPVFSEWEKEFFGNLDQQQIFQLIYAANYLNINSLLDASCGAIANSVLGKTPEQIYAMYGVTEKLTPEEEEEIRKENPWLADN